MYYITVKAYANMERGSVCAISQNQATRQPNVVFILFYYFTRVYAVDYIAPFKTAFFKFFNAVLREMNMPLFIKCPQL